MYETIRFARIDSATGEILAIGECPEEDIALQAETGETIIQNPPANVSDETHYYKAGAFKLFPTQPGDYSVFNFTTETWTDTRSTDRNNDFDYGHYDLQPTITVSPNSLSWGAFTVTRDNGVYSESKNRAAGSYAYPGSPRVIAYDWDSNIVTGFADMSAVMSNPRRFVLGEFRGNGEFIPRETLVDGKNLTHKSIYAIHIRANSIRGEHVEVDTLTGDHFKADSISVRELAVGFTDDIIMNQDLQTADGWAFTGTALPSHINSNLPSNAESAGNFVFPAIAEGESMVVWGRGGTGQAKRISVQPGDVIQWSAYFRASGAGGQARTRMAVWLYDKNNQYVSVIVRGIQYINPSQFQKITAEAVIPDGVAFIQVGFGRGGDPSNAHSMYIERPSIKKKVTGSLIVNGSIVTENAAENAFTNVYHQEYAGDGVSVANFNFNSVDKALISLTLYAMVQEAPSGGVGTGYSASMQVNFTDGAGTTTSKAANVYGAWRGSVAIPFKFAAKNGQNTVQVTMSNGLLKTLVIIEAKR